MGCEYGPTDAERERLSAIAAANELGRKVADVPLSFFRVSDLSSLARVTGLSREFQTYDGGYPTAEDVKLIQQRYDEYLVRRRRKK